MTARLGFVGPHIRGLRFPPVSPQATLALVAACHAAVQLFVVGLDIGLEWDEAVYASQAARDGAPIGFHPSRGWGPALLAAPVVAITDSEPMLRLYLTGVSALGLFLAFRVWLAVRPGHAIPVAAGFFAACWPTAFYGNQLMPNVYAALAAVALTGLVLRPAVTGTEPTRRVLAWTAALGLVLVLFRPSDALVVAGSLTVAVLVALPWSRRGPRSRRRATLRVLAALIAGSALGWGEWIVEALIRYGGVARRMAESTENFGPARWLVGAHLRALDGPLICSTGTTCGPFPTGGLVWAAACALLGATGVALAWYGGGTRTGGGSAPRHHGHRIALAVPIAVGACAAGAYLYFPGLTAPRYLLPGLALLAIPFAEGLACLVKAAHGDLRERVRRPGRVVSVAVLSSLAVAGHLYLHVGYLTDNVRVVKPIRAAERAAAAKIERLGIPRPCLVYGWSAPQIAYRLGCKAVGTPGWRPLPVTLPDSVREQAPDHAGYTIVTVFRDQADSAAAYLANWPEHRLTRTGWYARVLVPRPPRTGM